MLNITQENTNFHPKAKDTAQFTTALLKPKTSQNTKPKNSVSESQPQILRRIEDKLSQRAFLAQSLSTLTELKVSIQPKTPYYKIFKRTNTFLNMIKLEIARLSIVFKRRSSCRKCTKLSRLQTLLNQKLNDYKMKNNDHNI